MSRRRAYLGYVITFGNESGSRWWWAVEDPEGRPVGGAGQAKTKDEALTEARGAVRRDLQKKQQAA